MRFAVTATDRYLNIFQTLVERGWTPVKVFTGKVDNRIHRNAAVLDYAKSLKLDVQISRLTDTNLRELHDVGCEALVVASYEWRIGDWRPHLKYAVNFHPAPLPRGRGPYPIPSAILDGATTWGIACHKVEHEFDAGDVLHTVEFPLSASEDHAATPQSDGSYHSKWTELERRLDFSQSVQEILRRVRAFGPLECIAKLGKTTLFVRRAIGWTEAHSVPPGTVVHANSLALVVAAADGYIGLTEWSLINPEAVTGTLRR
jgi:methionyl-tRNA formyltransferase